MMGKIKLAAAMLMAGMIGAGAMMFMAPTSGKRMRGRLVHRGMELKDDMMDRAEDVRANAQKMFQAQNKRMNKIAKRRMGNARGMTSDLQGTAQKTYQQTRSRLSQAAQERMNDARAMASDMQDRGQQMIARRKKRASRWARVGRMVLRVL